MGEDILKWDKKMNETCSLDILVLQNQPRDTLSLLICNSIVLPKRKESND